MPAELADGTPPFPQSEDNQWSNRAQTPTHTYHFCISPLTPDAVRGVIWIPEKDNLGEDLGGSTPSLEVYPGSLAQTYGQRRIRFLFAHPTASLVEGLGQPQLDGA